MKIQYALMSCNADSRYTEYWPTVASAWLKLGITPVCLFIPSNPTVKLPEAPSGIVHTFSPLNGIHISIQSLTLRFWGGCLYPKDIVIVSAIDLIPLSRHFFCTQLAAYPDHAYLHLNHSPGKYLFHSIFNIPEKITHLSRYRIIFAGFHIAKGEVMHRVFDFSQNWETSCKKPSLTIYMQKRQSCHLANHMHIKGSFRAVAMNYTLVFVYIILTTAPYSIFPINVNIFIAGILMLRMFINARSDQLVAILLPILLLYTAQNTSFS